MRSARANTRDAGAPTKRSVTCQFDATLARYASHCPRAKWPRLPAEAASRPKKSDFRRAQNRVADILHKTKPAARAQFARRKSVVAAADKARCLGARAHQAPASTAPGAEMVSGVETIVGARNDALYVHPLGRRVGLVELTKTRPFACCVTQSDIAK